MIGKRIRWAGSWPYYDWSRNRACTCYMVETKFGTEHVYLPLDCPGPDKVPVNSPDLRALIAKEREWDINAFPAVYPVYQ